MNRRKVCLVQEIIPSYRVPVFRRIAELEDVDLTVLYSRESRVMRRNNLRNASNIGGFRHKTTGLLELGSRRYQFGTLLYVLIERPDVVIAGPASRSDRLLLLFLCKILRVRVLWYLGGVPYLSRGAIEAFRIRGRSRRWFGRYDPVRWSTLRADGLIVYSEHARNYYIEEGFSPDRVWVATNAPDTAALLRYRDEWLTKGNEVERERRRLVAGADLVVFLLGRLNVDRKVDVLLRALARLTHCTVRFSLVMVGDGAEREGLRKLADSLGLDRVFFEGAIYDEKELCRYLLVSDIFVTPGVASMALKMAMTLGKPVVTADYGLEVHDVEDGVNGFVFPAGDDEALATKLNCLLESPDLRERMGRAGMATMRHRINIDRLVEGFHCAIVNRPVYRTGQCRGALES